MLRRLIVSAALATGTLVLAPGAADGADIDVPFETLGIVSDTVGINLWQPSLVAIRSTEDIAPTREALADGYDGSFADSVIEAVGDEVPADRVVLIGIIDSSCTAALRAGLVRTKDGNLSMNAPGHIPEPIECFVAVQTVAVLLVDADDAPIGSTDFAELVAFEFAGYQPRLGTNAMELTGNEDGLCEIMPSDAEVVDLPPLDPGDRRFAFVRSSCGYDAVELLITRRFVDARLQRTNPEIMIDCARAAWSLVVFDISSEYLPDEAAPVGSLDR